MSLTLPGSGALVLPSGSTAAASPATGDRSTQLATMQMFAEEFLSSKTADGYMKFPNGIIVQWVIFSTFPGLTSVKPWAIPFPTGVLCCVATDIGVFNSGVSVDPTNSQVTVNCGTAIGGAYVLAIGH